MSRFAKLLGLIALGALAIRWLYAYDIRDYLVQGDAMTFHLVGQGLADGQGFIEHVPPGGPTAEHPPALFVLWGLVDKLGANGFLAHRLVLGLIGVGTVVLIGLLARRIGGDRLGLVAAALAAVYPMLWTAEGSLMSEGLYGFFLVAALLTAMLVRERPSPARAHGNGPTPLFPGRRSHRRRSPRRACRRRSPTASADSTTSCRGAPVRASIAAAFARNRRISAAPGLH